MIQNEELAGLIESMRETVTSFKGGLCTDDMLNCIASMVTRNMQTVETGCGLTTIAFAYSGRHHTCIDPQPDKAFAVAHAIPPGMTGHAYDHECASLHYWQSGRIKDGTLDFALMDGDDVSPACVFDAVYLAVLVKPGGHILIDDVAQPWIKVALAVLDAWPGWEVAMPIGSRAVLYRRNA